MKRRLPSILIATGVFVAAFSTGGRAQALPPEFAGLDRPANFEAGALRLGDQTYVLDKVAEKDDYWARIQGLEDSALVFDDDEDPTEFRLVMQGTEYEGVDFEGGQRPSSAIAGHSVLEYSGAFVGKDGEQLPAAVRITESLTGGGDSELSVQGDRAVLRGELGTRTYNQVFDLIRRHPEVKTLVVQEVGGSVNDEVNMQTGRLIRRAGLATHIPGNGEAYSGGVDLFCSGARRSLGAGAKVGVHSWSGDEGEAVSFPPDHRVHKAQIDYFTEMLGDPLGREFYLFTIRSAPADGMHEMNAEEIARFQLVTP